MRGLARPPRRRPGVSLNARLDRLSEGRFALVVLAPGLVLVGTFVLVPMLAAVGMSFFRIELLRDDLTPFVGLRNYLVRLPQDAEFLGALPRTLGFAAVTSAIAVPLAFAAAAVIHARTRFARWLAVVLLLPWAIAPIADGILWRLMFEPRNGIASHLLAAVGLPPVVIREAPGALIALLVAVTWRAIPILAILFLGALKRIPADIRMAARLDGATRFQTFRYVTWPAIARIVIAASMLQFILTLQVFEVQYALSQAAPPTGSILAGLAIFNTVIGDISLGYGSALTMVLALLSGVVLGALYLVVGRSPATRGRPADRGPEPTEPVAFGEARFAFKLRVRPASTSTVRADPRADRRQPDRQGSPRARKTVGQLRRIAGDMSGAAVALVLLICVAGPLIWIGVASTQPTSALATMPPQLTLDLDLSGYRSLITDDAWQRAALTSVTVTVLGTLLALGVALLAGYPLARVGMRWTRVPVLLLLATMLIPPIALAIPVLHLVIWLGVRDTWLGLVLLNAAFWSPILIWLVRGAFSALPAEIERAARMDGCSRIGSIFKVSLPAAAPVIAAATAITFIGIWNDFVFVAVVGGRETHTLPRYLGESASPALNVFAATIVLTVAPCVALLAVFRRRILAFR